MFITSQFGPASIQGPKVPRAFSYENNDDTLDEIKQPGYFDAQKLVIRENTRIDVVAKDCFGSIWVAGVFEGKLCVYKNDRRTKRGDIMKPVDKEEKKTKAA